MSKHNPVRRETHCLSCGRVAPMATIVGDLCRKCRKAAK